MNTKDCFSESEIGLVVVGYEIQEGRFRYLRYEIEKVIKESYGTIPFDKQLTLDQLERIYEICQEEEEQK